MEQVEYDPQAVTPCVIGAKEKLVEDETGPMVHDGDVPDGPSLNSDGQPKPEFIWTLVQIASIWAISDIGYYLLPTLGVQSSYNESSVAITLYYFFCAGISVITFWPVYLTWSLYGRWTTFGSRLTSLAVWTLSFAAFTVFAAYVLPHLPPVDWKESWNPPDVRIATPSYFLPKTIEIVFQQLLIVALVLTLAARRYSLWKISIYCAVLFGGTHVLLALGGVPLGYVVRFMVAGTVFGFVFPYLILRVPNGLAYSYIVHWLYYAASVVLPHIFAVPVK